MTESPRLARAGDRYWLAKHRLLEVARAEWRKREVPQ